MTLQQKYLKRITYINAKIFFLTMQHTKNQKKKREGVGGAEVVFYFMLSQLSKIDKTFDTKD